jgi:hypothetical protein
MFVEKENKAYIVEESEKQTRKPQIKSSQEENV